MGLLRGASQASLRLGAGLNLVAFRPASASCPSRALTRVCAHTHTHEQPLSNTYRHFPTHTSGAACRGLHTSTVAASPASAGYPRSASSTIPPLVPPEEKPDYYRILGVPRGANLDSIKAAFREQAKLYHPDVLAKSGAPPNVDAFKLINEAYSVLSDPALRRQYDADAAGFDRTAALRRRNEGWDAPAVPDAMSATPEDHMEHYRASMARATERARESAKFRGSLARLNRMKITVPSKQESYIKLAYPLGIFALWAFNYFVFMR